MEKRDIKRFLEKVNKTKNCWLWTACKDENNYGFFRFNGRVTRSHRISYIFFVGPIPKGLNVLHKCDNPPCVNPAHLFIGTLKDNTQDCIKKGRHVCTRENVINPRNKKLTITQVEKIRELYSSKKYFLREIAPMFGVNISCISKIVNFVRWK